MEWKANTMTMTTARKLLKATLEPDRNPERDAEPEYGMADKGRSITFMAMFRGSLND